MNNSLTAATYIDIESRKLKRDALKNAPVKTIFHFVIHVEAGRIRKHNYSIIIYPQKGETDQTANDRIETAAKLSYGQYLKIELLGMEEIMKEN